VAATAAHGALGATPGAGQSGSGDGGQQGWVTGAARLFPDAWVAVFETEDDWRTTPAHGLILQQHPNGRSRVLAAHLDGDELVPLLQPRPAACVPVVGLDFWMAKAREKA
jgi:hypothetical protein